MKGYEYFRKALYVYMGLLPFGDKIFPTTE